MSTPSRPTGMLGYLDGVRDGVAYGWCLDLDRPGEPLTVAILVDGRPVVTAVADQPRADVAAAGYGDGSNGFALVVPDDCCDGHAHEIRAVAGCGTGRYELHNRHTAVLARRRPGPDDGVPASIETERYDATSRALSGFADAAILSLGRRRAAFAEGVEVIGLGTHCYTANLLKRSQLRALSTPFDWIFSNLPAVAHCITDDFATFLNGTFHELSPVDLGPGHGRGPSEHAWYRAQFGVVQMFNHHDLRDPEDAAYFRRCVERFRRTCANGRTKLFLACTRRYAALEADALRIAQALDGVCSGFAVVVVAVEEGKGAAMPLLDVRPLGERCILASLRPCSEWGPLAFGAAVDDLAVLQALFEGGRRSGVLSSPPSE